MTDFSSKKMRFSGFLALLFMVFLNSSVQVLAQTKPNPQNHSKATTAASAKKKKSKKSHSVAKKTKNKSTAHANKKAKAHKSKVASKASGSVQKQTTAKGKPTAPQAGKTAAKSGAAAAAVTAKTSPTAAPEVAASPSPETKAVQSSPKPIASPVSEPVQTTAAFDSSTPEEDNLGLYIGLLLAFVVVGAGLHILRKKRAATSDPAFGGNEPSVTNQPGNTDIDSPNTKGGTTGHSKPANSFTSLFDGSKKRK